VDDSIKLGISTCLLGENVRYDGGHKLDHYLKDTLGKFVQWVPVCPEVECGLPVPREAMRLVGDPDSPRLMTVRTGIDHTEHMTLWAQKRLDELSHHNLCGFIFKSRSPSSGMSRVKVYGKSSSPLNKGVGIFARAFMERYPFVPVEDDGRLHDPKLRENFIERIFVFKRWQLFSAQNPTTGGLVDFHTAHKLMIMAHSPNNLNILGKLVAHVKDYRAQDMYNEYMHILMKALRLIATVKKNVNVLHHIMGYFKKLISSDEKQELLEVINNYHEGFVPLIVPVVLMQHYIRKYDEPYLKKQHYLNPHSVELMLRNHV
jgi:uncharacterized protein YbgA (DUF1722 family)/uncharacterized protein YbbK (DUF523 family)